jgi:hypothetical protein
MDRAGGSKHTCSPTSLSKEEWLNKTEYYLSIKKKELLTHAMTWMSLEDIMVSETSHCLFTIAKTWSELSVHGWMDAKRI